MQKKEEEECVCVKRFIFEYNRVNSTNFSIIKPNPEKKSPVDVFVLSSTSGNILKIQVTRADYSDSFIIEKNASDRAKGKTKELIGHIKDPHNVEPIIHSIKIKIKKYSNQSQDIKNIILLLDDVRFKTKHNDFEKRFLDKGCDDIQGNFKEIWYVPHYSVPYKII